MTQSDLSDEIKQFLFSYIDSVELLEILLLMQSQATKGWTAIALSKELRGSTASAEKRLLALVKIGLVKAYEPAGHFIYSAPSPEIDALVRELADLYKMQRHRILEMIFSPMKKARDFADAFKIKKGEPKE